MVTSILTVMEQVVELFLMIGVGVVCSRVGMFTRRGAAGPPAAVAVCGLSSVDAMRHLPKPNAVIQHNRR